MMKYMDVRIMNIEGGLFSNKNPGFKRTGYVYLGELSTNIDKVYSFLFLDVTDKHLSPLKRMKLVRWD